MERMNIPRSVWYNLAFGWILGLAMPTIATVFFFRSVGESVTYFVGIILALLLGTRLAIRQYGMNPTVTEQAKEQKKRIYIEYRKGILHFIPVGGCLCQFSDIISLPDSANAKEKARIFRNAFELAGKDQPWPTNWIRPSPEVQAFLNGIGIKTWGRYIKGVLRVFVDWNKETNMISFLPSRLDQGDSTEDEDVPPIEIPADSPAKKIAETIDRALERCVGYDGWKKTDPTMDTDDEAECYAVGFAYKILWMVFRTQDPQKVAEKLDTKNIREVDWFTGIEESYKNSVFVTPPVDGWVIAVGRGLSDFSSLDDSSRQLLESWSREFGEVQFFETHRVCELHSWIKAIDGRIVRAYSYLGESGETLVNEGEPTAVEQGYQLIDTNSPEAQDDDYWEREDIFTPNEGFVLKVAESWSIDPSTLEMRGGIAEKGLLGK